MTISVHSAAERACQRADWRLTNLQLQKILYIAHMIYLGEKGEPLIDEAFQAWDYGPVLPSLYHDIKMFGRHPVADIFFGAKDVSETDEGKCIDSVVGKLKSWSPGQLVAFTHRAGGAWANHYHPGARGIEIPNESIAAEYADRTRKAA